MKISSEDYTIGSKGVSMLATSCAASTSSLQIKFALSCSTVLKLMQRCLEGNDLNVAARLVFETGTQHLEAVLMEAIGRNCLTIALGVLFVS